MFSDILFVDYKQQKLLFSDSLTRWQHQRRKLAEISQSSLLVGKNHLRGAIAIDCVSRAEISSRVAGVVVENTFTSIPDMAKVLFSNVRLLSKLPVWCHKNKYSSRQKMCRLVVPALLLSGQSDTLVPPRMMTELYHLCASENRRLMQFNQGTHNETWKCPGYYQAIMYFMDEVY
ncbi:unnamed protein product, partial [Meganyctiphanes norvegica]